MQVTFDAFFLNFQKVNVLIISIGLAHFKSAFQLHFVMHILILLSLLMFSKVKYE